MRPSIACKKEDHELFHTASPAQPTEDIDKRFVAKTITARQA